MIWSVTLYGEELGTLKGKESRISKERISFTLDDGRSLLSVTARRQKTWIGSLLKDVLEGRYDHEEERKKICWIT